MHFHIRGSHLLNLIPSVQSKKTTRQEGPHVARLLLTINPTRLCAWSWNNLPLIDFPRNITASGLPIMAQCCDESFPKDEINKIISTFRGLTLIVG